MKRLLIEVALAGVLAAGVAGSASSAAVSPQCGDVLTADVTLVQDLACSGTGFTIPGSFDVTLDLAGHTISGDGSGAGIDIEQDVAFGVGSGQGHITVKNGTIKGFGAGVGLFEEFGGSPLGFIRLRRLTIMGNGTGVLASGGDLRHLGTTLVDSTIAENRFDGVDSANYRPFELINDKIRHNGGFGINAFDDSLDLLENTVLAHNAGPGARLTDTVAQIIGNTFLGNGGIGLHVDESFCTFVPFYLVSDNVATQNGGGGMEWVSNGCFPETPPGSGNASQNNALFQCLLIICAKNRGPEPDDARASGSDLPVHHR